MNTYTERGTYQRSTSTGSFIPESNLKRVVIVGGGFGGVELAKRLDRDRFQVVLIDKNNYHTFQPLLYQVATGGLEAESIAFPLRKIFSRHKNFIFRMAEAQAVNKEDSVLITDLGEIHYDYLVLAMGSTTNFFGNAEIESGAMGMKNVTEALDLRSLILQNFEKLLSEKNPGERKKYLNIVIVGGGPTGVEVAGALAELKRHVLPRDYPELNIKDLQIHVIEASGRLLAGMSKVSSEKAKDFLEELGVKLWLNTSVKHFRDEKVVFGESETIDSNTLIWTAGVKGALIKGFGEQDIAKGSRIKTDMYNRATGTTNLFVIGDLAAVNDPDLVAPYPMVAPVAIQQAKNLARNLNEKDESKWKKFKYNNQGSMATVGRNKAVVDLRRIHFQGIMAWYVWMFVHLMSIVGFRNRLIVFINWVWNYFSYDRAIRLIIRPFKKNRALSTSLKVLIVASGLAFLAREVIFRIII